MMLATMGWVYLPRMSEASTKDGTIFTRPWSFRVEEITFEKLFLWHGEQDRISSAATVRLLAQALPHCTATFYPDEGHFSTLAHHAPDFFSQLRGPSSTARSAQPR